MYNELNIILDCDDVLMDCIGLAAQIVSDELEIKIKKEDITGWIPASDKKLDRNDPELKTNPEKIRQYMLEKMQTGEFLRNQKPFPGAQEFVRALKQRGHKVMLFSAVPPQVMGVRAQQILDYFDIDPRNITLGGNKSAMSGDILLDDCLGNIDGSMCRYPILFQQPWNRHDKRFLSVKDYDEALALVDRIAQAPRPRERKATRYGKPGFVALVGPSASGKTSILTKLLEDPRFALAKAVTTRAPRDNDRPDEYQFVDDVQFEEMLEAGELMEHSEYAGNKYGLSIKDVQRIWDSGHIPVKAMDINGALAVKQHLGNRAVTVFIRRDKKAILEALIKRNSPPEDIANRIMSLDTEFQNELRCDSSICNNNTVEEAVSQLLNII